MHQHTNIHAVIFDLGGVIIRTEDGAPRAALAGRLGISRAALEEAVFNNPVSKAAERGEATADQVWEEAARRLGLPTAALAGASEDFFGGDRVDMALVDFIRALRPAFRTAALSNAWVVDLPAWLRDSVGIADAFDVMISSAKAGVRKPDERIFRLALEQLGVQPGESVFVDDFPENVAAAAALGMHAVHFTGVDKAVRALRDLLGLDAGRS